MADGGAHLFDPAAQAFTVAPSASPRIVAYSGSAKASGHALRSGLVPLAGVPTKHYLREEAQLMLAAYGFDAFRFDKLEYGWETEFAEPPGWMKDPRPWDWLVSARRRTERQGGGNA